MLRCDWCLQAVGAHFVRVCVVCVLCVWLHPVTMLTSLKTEDTTVEPMLRVLSTLHHDEGDYIRCVVELINDVKDPLEDGEGRSAALSQLQEVRASMVRGTATSLRRHCVGERVFIEYARVLWVVLRRRRCSSSWQSVWRSRTSSRRRCSSNS